MSKKILMYIPIFLSLLIPIEGHILPAIGGDLINNASPEIRHPVVAGTFYPASASQLRKTITTMLDAIPAQKPEGDIVAAIAPHAGYVFSGKVAAHTYKQLMDVDFDTVIIIGHDSYQNAVAFTCPVDYFQTPLGKMPVDREFIDKIQGFDSGIKANRLIHYREHTIEAQLPFLQVLGKRCKIVPILFGNPTQENCRILSDAIISAAGNKRVLVLASTDMSHYPSYDSARKVDNSTLETLKALDINRLFTHLKEQQYRQTIPNLQTAMCARGGVGTAILFARAHGANKVQILCYANSGDVPAGDKHRVVGYSSALFIKTTGSPSE